ncbi:MAG: hypothetical protein ABIJ92_04780 [Candidatus Aenigmatarchaeota archaeon]
MNSSFKTNMHRLLADVGVVPSVAELLGRRPLLETLANSNTPTSAVEKIMLRLLEETQVELLDFARNSRDPNTPLLVYSLTRKTDNGNQSHDGRETQKYALLAGGFLEEHGINTFYSPLIINGDVTTGFDSETARNSGALFVDDTATDERETYLTEFIERHCNDIPAAGYMAPFLKSTFKTLYRRSEV